MTDYWMYKDFLAHSKGPWKIHKYVKKVGNPPRYIYARKRGKTTASGGVFKRDIDPNDMINTEGGSGTEKDPYVIVGKTYDAYEKFLADPQVQDMINVYCSNQPNSMKVREEMDRTGKYMMTYANQYFELDLHKAGAGVKEQARKKAISNIRKEYGIKRRFVTKEQLAKKRKVQQRKAQEISE